MKLQNNQFDPSERERSSNRREAVTVYLFSRTVPDRDMAKVIAVEQQRALILGTPSGVSGIPSQIV